MTDIKTSQLIDAIYAKLKIRLGENDPAFVLVELNRLILTQAIREALNIVKEHHEKLVKEALEASASKTGLATDIANRVATVIRNEFRESMTAQRQSAHNFKSQARCRPRAFTTLIAAVIIAMILSFLAAHYPLRLVQA
jgi:capsular polysaccharide biosynthesis protein